MRDALFFMFVLALVPVAVAAPYIGVLVWSWLSFMNPHRETYGAAFSFPFVFYIAALTLGAWFVSREPKVFFRGTTTLLMLAFLLWTCLTTFTAFDRAWSYPQWLLNFKTFVLAFAVVGLMTTKTRIHAMIWVIALSLGYFATKGAGFLIATAGQYKIFGPSYSMIYDNNNLGLALGMAFPLLNYLRITSKRPFISYILLVVMALTVITIIGTYSRGGLFGLTIVGAALWLRSRQKMIFVFGAIILLIALPSFMPPQWFERMSTIKEYSADESFEGRVQAWNVSTNIAVARPLTGGGFNVTQLDDVFAKYNKIGALKRGTAAHSIYFQVLGDHGFVGLAIYLLMVISSFVNLQSVIHAARDREELQWARDLAAMMQVSFVGLLGAGALLSMAYYDVFIVLIAISVNLRVLVRQSKGVTSSKALVPWRRAPEPVS